jgi:hypothetical protein
VTALFSDRRLALLPPELPLLQRIVASAAKAVSTASGGATIAHAHAVRSFEVSATQSEGPPLPQPALLIGALAHRAGILPETSLAIAIFDCIRTVLTGFYAVSTIDSAISLGAHKD